VLGPGQHPRPAHRFHAAAAADGGDANAPAALTARDRAHGWTGGRDAGHRRLARELGVDAAAVRAADRVAASSTPTARSRRGPQAADPRAHPPAAPAVRDAAPATAGRHRARAPPLRAEQWAQSSARLPHLRRTIAERAALSATLIPHVTTPTGPTSPISTRSSPALERRGPAA
jgi:pyruvate/2-oxoglutarate dehydrogenase complex dihydrolipoamide acyltransferase (E2) component